VEPALENMGISRVLERGCVTVYAGVKERLALHHMGLNTPGEADHMYLQRLVTVKSSAAKSGRSRVLLRACFATLEYSDTADIVILVSKYYD
jgi:hypothetical protein